MLSHHIADPDADTADAQVLVADFFFILAALGWLGIGVAAQTSGASTVRASLPHGVALRLLSTLMMMVVCSKQLEMLQSLLKSGQ